MYSLKKSRILGFVYFVIKQTTVILPKSAVFIPPLTFLTLLCLVVCSCGNDGSNNSSPEGVTNDQAERSYENLAETDVAARLNQQADSVFEMGEYPAAIALYQQSMDSAAAAADSFPYYDSKLDLACVHDRLGEPKKAIEIAEPVIDAFLRSGDSSRIGRAYTHIAGFYGKANLPEKSMAATTKGFDFLKQQGSLINRCAAYNQMAFTYSDMGHWDKALPLLDTALQLMELSGILNQRPGMHLNIGDCHRNLGHWAEARRYLEAAAAEADSLGQAHVHSRAVERLSQVAEATGDPVSALRLFRQAKSIRDSIFTAEKDHTLRELEVGYRTREKEQQINLLQAEKKAEQSRRWLLIAGFVFTLFLLGFILYANRLKLARTRQALAQNRQDLYEYTQLLLTKNARLAALEQAVQQPDSAAANDARKNSDDPHPESLYNSRILTDEDWEMFKRRFESSHPGYLLRLRTAYPDLSGAEERLLLLVKLGLTSQEVADTLGITANGVKKGRQRLRKRLEIAPEEDLEQFVKVFLLKGK
ncbi:MAG: tetratricopeptide repeat protein [Lewinellaceae bacterium]|nr:tetratricopeptide repeat protein [Lewinellaceae bacterium]